MKTWIGYGFMVLVAFAGSWASASANDDLPATINGFELPEGVTKLKPLKSECAKQPLQDFYFRICEKNDLQVIEYYVNREFLGQLKFSYIPSQETALWVDEVQIDENSRGQGLSILLFKKMFELAGPNITDVAGQMADSNYMAIMNEYYEITTPDEDRFIPELTRGEANVLAVQASPFAKALKLLGYGDIGKASFKWVTSKGSPYVSEILVRIHKSEKRRRGARL